MSKLFTVSLQTHADAVIEVEAESVEAAIEKAHAELYVKLCHACSREVQLGDEWDATAVDVDGSQVWSAS